jgi:hypothetical protein
MSGSRRCAKRSAAKAWPVGCRCADILVARPQRTTHGGVDSDERFGVLIRLRDIHFFSGVATRCGAKRPTMLKCARWRAHLLKMQTRFI